MEDQDHVTYSAASAHTLPDMAACHGALLWQAYAHKKCSSGHGPLEGFDVVDILFDRLFGELKTGTTDLFHCLAF